MEPTTDLSIKIKSLRNLCARNQKKLLNQVLLLDKEEDIVKWNKLYKDHIKNVEKLLCDKNIRETGKLKLKAQLEKLKNLQLIVAKKIRKNIVKENDKKERRLMQNIEENLIKQMALLKTDRENKQWVKDCDTQIKCLNDYLSLLRRGPIKRETRFKSGN